MARTFGYPCPECGEWSGLCREVGRDVDGRRVRRRSCTNCALTFTTVEVVSPVSLHRLVNAKQPVRLDAEVKAS